MFACSPLNFSPVQRAPLSSAFKSLKSLPLQTRAQKRRASPICCSAESSEGDRLCRAVAEQVVDAYVRDGHVVGLGTGVMTNHAIQYLGQRLEEKSLQRVRAVPASDVSASEAAFHGVPQTDLHAHPELDVMLMDVDEIDGTDPHLACIVGRQAEPQQPQLVRLRHCAAAAKQLVGLVESKQQVVPRLQGYLPVVIQGQDWEEPAEEIDDCFIGDAEIWRRPRSGTANPRGGDMPYISPEGHNLLDVRFAGRMTLDGREVPYSQLAAALEDIPGVVTHGLLAQGLTAAVIAAPEGPVTLEPGVQLANEMSSSGQQQQLEQ
ncbi:hypothetical protein WJX72_008086 [[Myrmecia] bisecta]|uniref:ribose-5-phosphate isomerase n=1 Tax=[Myrmecia] bisecta TaxID=41462 RepID=A0AAW1PK93_9CHLO